MFCVGIDWSDEKLDYHLRTLDGKVLAEGFVKHSPDGIIELFLALERHATPGDIGIAIETKHGAWVQAFLDRGYLVYPVNPKSVDNFRKAFSANGEKSDQIDARALALYLVMMHERLQPLRPDDPEIVSLRIACQDRVRLVEEHTAKLNELRSILKVHYPPVLKLFGNLESKITLQFLLKYPTQDQMLHLTERGLRGWLKRKHYSAPHRIPEMVELLRRPALPVSEHLQKAKAPRIGYLAKSLLALQAEIAERKKQITKDFKQLPESDWADSLPGVGPNLGPAILSTFGRDPNRFAEAPNAQAFFGTAPTTKASGKSREVIFRRGCYKFGRRTLQLFADQSRHACAWAERFYDKQNGSGHTHHQALRALAHKWVKIIERMKKTKSRYVEAVFVGSQERFLVEKAARESR